MPLKTISSPPFIASHLHPFIVWERIRGSAERAGKLLHRCVNISLSSLFTSLQLYLFPSSQLFTAARFQQKNSCISADTEIVKTPRRNRWETIKVNHRLIINIMLHTLRVEDYSRASPFPSHFSDAPSSLFSFALLLNALKLCPKSHTSTSIL